MAARATAERVKEIIQTSLIDEVIASNMILTANEMVNAHLLTAGHTSKVLELIELYLAAHYVALTEERGGLTESEFGDARERYSDIYQQGVNSTRFGQTALSLDSSGLLAAAISGIEPLKASFRVV